MYEAEFAQGLEVIAPGVTTLIDENAAQGESWVDSLARLLPILATTYQQRQLLEVQIERARAGQPPLDVSMYAPGVRVGVTDDTKTMLYVVAGIAIALLAAPAVARAFRN